LAGSGKTGLEDIYLAFMATTNIKLCLLSLINLGLLFELFTGGSTINDLTRYGLKGKVRSVMEIKFAIPDKDSKESENQAIYQRFTVYNEEGYVQEIKLYKNNEEFLVTNFIADGEGKPLEMNEFLPDGTLNLNVKYKYNEDTCKSEAIYNWSEDRVIGEICEPFDYYFDIIQNGIFTRALYSYEYRGYCTEEKFLKADSSTSFKLVSKYDFRGNRLESAYFSGTGMMSWTTKYTYDRYDNMIESRVLKSNRIAIESEYKYQFDDTGNWISRKEKRVVYVNILTAGLDQRNTVTERTIEYY
jgi:hypothetical protein